MPTGTSFARIVLLLNAAAWLGFGLMLLIAPTRLDGVGLVVDNPLGRIEVRGFYGGLELGIAAFLCWSAARRDRLSAGLLLAALAVGATATGRLIGIALEGGQTTASMWTFVAIEATGCVLSLAARRALRGDEAPGSVAESSGL